MILVIAERVNNRSITDERVARWRQRWDWRTALALNCNAGYGSLKRLAEFFPKWCKYQVINILPPDNKAGTWDSGLARKMVSKAPEALDSDTYSGIVLLGRRVTDLFFQGVPFGTQSYYNGIPVLCMPHPSGRNRFWNDKNAKKKVRRWVKKFLAFC